MWKFNICFFFLVFAKSPLAFSQAFWTAPKADKVVKEIIEWHRPNLKVLASQKAISGYDLKGNLIYHYLVEKPLEKNTYRYDAQNRILEKVEYFEGIKHRTNYSYSNKLQVQEHRFHDKTYRICDYYKNKKRVERKVFAKGGEMENKYLLLKRNLFFYHKNDSLKSEKIAFYGIQGSKKGKIVSEESIVHHYHSGGRFKSHIEFFNLDKSLRKERHFTYNSKGRISQILDYFHVEQKVEVTDLKYKEGQLWQRIFQKNDQKDVLVFHKKRPIRLRSYMAEKINKVVDYAYVYY